jgi:hypothetical protein
LEEEMFCSVINTVYVEGKLSRSMRAGILSLIYKKKGDKRVLKASIISSYDISVSHIILSSSSISLFTD